MSIRLRWIDEHRPQIQNSTSASNYYTLYLFPVHAHLPVPELTKVTFQTFRVT